MRLTGIWGHRGARGLFPENTLEGIRDALGLGLDGVEIDVALSADGTPVLSHDARLSGDIARAPDGRWVTDPGPLIRCLTDHRLASYDVGRLRPGRPTARRFPAQRPRDGARIPSLGSVLALGCRLIAELKTFPDRPADTAPAVEMAAAVCAAIRSAGAGGRVVVESFDWRGPRWVRTAYPDIPIALLTRADTERAARLWWGGPHPADFGGSVPRAVAAEGARCWAPEWTTLHPERIAEAHALGLAVLAWTVNAPDAIARLLRAGVDGIITDFPDSAAAAVRCLSRNRPR